MSSTQSALVKFCLAAITLPWRDCAAYWCGRGGSRVNYTIYIFRNNTEYVNTDFHFIVGGVILYRPLYIHQVFTSCFPFSFSVLFSQGLAHVSVQTVGVAFQYHRRLK